MSSRFSDVLDLRPQRGNRWQSAGITAREAQRLYKMLLYLDELSQKDGLWVRHKTDLVSSAGTILKVLNDAGRLK